jgi:CTP synthase
VSKHIFVTGGVVSSLGKGLTSASIGMLLESKGLGIQMQKIDPYINVDPGTMSPFQHGEVYVTDDGAETDLDLGHYERFTNAKLTQDCNFTTGTVYDTVISNERKGVYLGGTVQVVPHITDEIKRRILKVATPGTDVVITEIGGTVGDIEGLPFLEAIRQMRADLGRENVLYIHLTLVPFLQAAREIKTKPTQHSVAKLREIGIQPDILICRTQRLLSGEVKDKIALFCNVSREAVIEEKDVDYSVYELPVVFVNQQLDQLIIRLLGLSPGQGDMREWTRILEIIRQPKHQVRIAVVGKYIRLHSAYQSIYEALTHGGIANQTGVEVKKIESEEVEKQGAGRLLSDVEGILVPGGFGIRGTQGKVEVVRFARENHIPFFGICLGLQCASIEFARNLLGLEDADSTEFAPQTSAPVIDLLPEQRSVTDMGGTMRLGAYPCLLQKDSVAYKAYGVEQVSERHRHRYEFNNDYRTDFQKMGMRFSGLSPDGELVEIMELAEHPWFVATQFHPEFKSKPTGAHPLFKDFIAAALRCKRSKQTQEREP